MPDEIGLDPAPTDHKPFAVPRSLSNLVMLILAVLLVRRFIQIHFGVPISSVEVLGFPLAATLGGFLFKYLPADAQKWAGMVVTSLLCSRSTTIFATGILILAMVGAFSFTSIAVSWTGPPGVQIFKNGLRVDAAGEDSTHTRTFFTTSFRPVTITVKSYSKVIRPVPLKQSRAVVPFYVTASDIPELGIVENYLDLAMLQQTPAHYLEEAGSRIRHLKKASTGVGADALERLEDIANILQQALVEARQNDIKSHLVDAYREKYPFDSWLRPLEGVVAFSNSKYGDVIEKLDAFNSPGARWPRSSTIGFFKAIAHIRLANQYRGVDGKTRDVTSHLAAAQREFDLIINAALRSPDQEYVSTVRPAAYIFRGIAAFYQRDYDTAQSNFETVLRLEEADPILKGRAANGIGYLTLLRGDLKGARRRFQRALDYDGTIAIARVNLGYLLLIEGKYQLAASHFEQLLGDRRIMLKSPRDVLLAKLALGHAIDSEGKGQQALALYTDILNGLDQHDFSEVQEAELRWAYVYNSIGSKVYLYNRDYFALEPFALAMFGRACVHLCNTNSDTQSLQSQDTASDLKRELSGNITKAQALARLEWTNSFAMPHGLLNDARSILESGCTCAKDVQRHR